MTKLHKIFIIFFTLLAISGCKSIESLDTKAEYPKSQEDTKRARAGKLGGGLVLLGGKGGSSSDESGNVGIGINSYLWRASLDTLSFMPLASADPFGGVIITDWYEDKETPGERFKVNVLILDKELRSNALKVSVFKQQYKASSGWRDTEASTKVRRDLENRILTKARSLRVEKNSSK